MILGFRPDGGVLGVLAGIALLVVFSFAFSWMWTMFGLLLRTEKSVMGVSMMVLFPLTFLSNIFVDPRTMPGWLQAFVNNNPITHLVAAVRGLMEGEWPADEIAGRWAGRCCCRGLRDRSRCGCTTASERVRAPVRPGRAGRAEATGQRRPGGPHASSSRSACGPSSAKTTSSDSGSGRKPSASILASCWCSPS